LILKQKRNERTLENKKLEIDKINKNIEYIEEIKDYNLREKLDKIYHQINLYDDEDKSIINENKFNNVEELNKINL